jgi:hypothetical protein
LKSQGRHPIAPDLAEALSIQHQLVELAEATRRYGYDRSYLTADGQGYALAVQGEGARAMYDFMKAVGQYLTKVQHGRGEREAAKAELLRAFDAWLFKQKI